MVFIVDGSSSVGVENFALVQDFVINLVEESFRVENDSARVSSVQYCLIFHFFRKCILSRTIVILSFFALLYHIGAIICLQIFTATI